MSDKTTFDRPRTNYFCPECGENALQNCRCEPDDGDDRYERQREDRDD